MCASVNDVICHGIPDSRVLRPGDVVSFDVSCFVDGVHGDNCATVVVGDTHDDDDYSSCVNEHDNDWRGIRTKSSFVNDTEKEVFITARRLSQATLESLYAAISTCHPGSCLTNIGNAIADVADAYGYDSVRSYTGHGIGQDFHRPPFVKHYRNDNVLPLKPGMVITIEPMLTEGRCDCEEWESDGWTVVTKDGGRACQFEHMVCITEDGCDVLTGA